VRADAIQYKQKRQIVRPIARTIWRFHRTFMTNVQHNLDQFACEAATG
jgi:hypothetical protein